MVAKDSSDQRKELNSRELQSKCLLFRNFFKLNISWKRIICEIPVIEFDMFSLENFEKDD